MFKFNVDALCYGISEILALGRFKNHMGTKMVHFSKPIGMSDPTGTEIEAILEAFETLNDLPWMANPIPHIVPSTLGVKRPEPSFEPHGSTPNLERADQIHATRTQLD
ncbi:hypothetical protein V6N11_062887 [Hibiscus sabdariffa]|uniref:Uncharacterized protein n=1 Tax=Hibiscus sabdariffa TaxID=183260 RepID=A0ABR2NQ47_9ROSI